MRMMRPAPKKAAVIEAMIDVVIEDEDWADIAALEALAARCYDAALAFEPALSGEIALLLTNDAAMRALNAKYRGKDAPTNVLAFPGDDEKSGGFVGDIALARETCVREAKDKRIALQDHAAHLIIHAMLHLVGYDHQNDDDAEAMERREAEILNRLGIADPHDAAMETGR
ncbi:Metal-dependent hydrolase YbeY, involved in rRNA and/or ribosome maturation and assembly [hydrothermal vent metagenome]|uniref:Metal-dependent hydrolase YbeY, involved in rRNA and/or ribosome maturation and assembly n=1 Tax=hydrothermal vent metagenome TaxID=652676 RepID=A0A3B0RSG4_9ZZZZ